VTFEEDLKGTITVGKLADLVILSDDPRTVPIDNLPALKVLMTMIGGRVEFGSI
jgi:predicted amidohydrolase YtcJ